MQVEELSSIELEFIGESQNRFVRVIKEQIETHEGVTFVDLLKFLYQSVLGPHHIFDMMEEREIQKWVERSLSNALPTDNPLIERLYGKKWVRIDLGSFKKNYGNDSKTLFEIFLRGKKEKRDSIRRFSQLLGELAKLVKKGQIEPKSQVANLKNLVDSFLIDYRRKGFPPLHHSEAYTKKNNQYLVVSSQLPKVMSENRT